MDTNAVRREKYRLKYRHEQPTRYTKQFNKRKIEELIALMQLKKKRALDASEQRQETLLFETARAFLRRSGLNDQKSSQQLVSDIVRSFGADS